MASLAQGMEITWDRSRPVLIQCWNGGHGGWVLIVHSRILAALEDDMLGQHDLSLTWLDILDRLRQSPGQRMRMNELEQASLFTRSSLTRLIDKMEQAGLVQRERVPDDRRGIYVTITAASHEKVSRV
jgi:DNA-binding MarR family transcriptional regulator